MCASGWGSSRRLAALHIVITWGLKPALLAVMKIEGNSAALTLDRKFGAMLVNVPVSMPGCAHIAFPRNLRPQTPLSEKFPRKTPLSTSHPFPFRILIRNRCFYGEGLPASLILHMHNTPDTIFSPSFLHDRPSTAPTLGTGQNPRNNKRWTAVVGQIFFQI